MSGNVEELLRQGIDRLATTATTPADAASPATLLRRARHHNRRRRGAIAGALAAGGAAIAAVATFLATATPVVSVNGQTINYVTTRAERALAQLDQEKAVEYSTETIYGTDFHFIVLKLDNKDGDPMVPVLTNVHAVRQDAWTYQGRRLWQGFSATGALVYSYAVTADEVNGAVYPDRTQWHTPFSSQSPADVPANCMNAGFGYPSWAKSIGKAFSCHVLNLGGNQQVNGIEAIKLIRRIAGGYTTTLWVDPASYLPVRIAYGYPAGHGKTVTETVDLHWLAPTKANLARLHAAEQRGAIPAGFRTLPRSDFPESTINLPGSG
jgi:hypothetical protein